MSCGPILGRVSVSPLELSCGDASFVCTPAGGSADVEAVSLKPFPCCFQPLGGGMTFLSLLATHRSLSPFDDFDFTSSSPLDPPACTCLDPHWGNGVRSHNRPSCWDFISKCLLFSKTMLVADCVCFMLVGVRRRLCPTGTTNLRNNQEGSLL